MQLTERQESQATLMLKRLEDIGYGVLGRSWELSHHNCPVNIAELSRLQAAVKARLNINTGVSELSELQTLFSRIEQVEDWLKPLVVAKKLVRNNVLP